MLCPHCGAELASDAAICIRCGAILAPAVSPPDLPPVKDYLTVNIVLLALTALCCSCTPALVTGILGVVFASQVKSLVQDGKRAQAEEKSRLAKSLAIATGVLMGVTALLLIAYLLFFFCFYGVAFASLLNQMSFSALAALLL